MSPNIYLSVVIPCYNELQNLKNGALSDLDKYLSKQDFSYEIIISDDQSNDGSIDYVQKHTSSHIHLLKNAHGGKAFALRAGLHKSQGTYTLFTDMDQSTPIDQVNKLIKYADFGFPVVIGSRGNQRKNSSIWRKLASNLFGIFRRSLLLSQIKDTQCGFKLVQTDIAKDIFSKMMIFDQTHSAKGWTVAAWDVEFLFLAQKFKHPIKEVPVKWEDNDLSTSKERTAQKFIKESIDMLKQILRVRLNDLKGRYV